MATKKYTPSTEWNQNSPPGLHKGARNLRESLKLKNPNDFKPPAKEGFKKTGMSITKPEVVTELPAHVESPKEKIEDVPIGSQGTSYIYKIKDVQTETVTIAKPHQSGLVEVPTVTIVESDEAEVEETELSEEKPSKKGKKSKKSK